MKEITALEVRESLNSLHIKVSGLRRELEKTKENLSTQLNIATKNLSNKLDKITSLICSVD